MAILIEGAPFTGKSTLARQVAEATGYRLVTEWEPDPRIVVDGGGGLDLMVVNSVRNLPTEEEIDSYRIHDARKRILGTVTVVLAINPEDAYLLAEREYQDDERLARTQALNLLYFGLATGQSTLWDELRPDIDAACLMDEHVPFPVSDIGPLLEAEQFLRQRRNN